MKSLGPILKIAAGDESEGGPDWLARELVVCGWNYNGSVYLVICGLQEMGECFNLLGILHLSIGDQKWKLIHNKEIRHFDLYILTMRAARQYCHCDWLFRWRSDYDPMPGPCSDYRILVKLA